MKRLLASVSFVLWGFCLNAAAQEPLVRSSLAKQDEMWVGQRITIVVELLVPGYFSGAPSFDLPGLKGMLLIPPSGSPVVGSEQIDGVTYTVQRYGLAVFSRLAGEQTVPAFPVRFFYKRQPLDKDAIPAKGNTEPLKFTAKLPPGAENLGSIISARDLQVVESWKPEPGKAKAGDAFTRTITYTAPDVPAMAFPPFPVGKIDGLGIYPKDPLVLDKSERGVLSGKRIDSVTYVCERAGDFTLPAVKLTWFDLGSHELRTIDFPAHTFSVEANPALESAGTTVSRKVPWVPIIWTALAICVVGTAAFLMDISRLMEALRRAVAFFRPVHLPPLNPPKTKNQPTS